MSNMVSLICCQCRQPMWITSELHTAARASEKIMFYCGFGHEQHFPKQESDEHRFRRERDRAWQQLAERDDRIREMMKEQKRLSDEANKARIARRKVVHRISNGVCPHCNRSFVKLAAHMKTKHPDFKAEAA